MRRQGLALGNEPQDSKPDLAEPFAICSHTNVYIDVALPTEPELCADVGEISTEATAWILTGPASTGNLQTTLVFMDH
ncbi:hypothetical protein RSO01_83350 [Reyranella soli]|uniref:Uncharacterized protein n=1 Tax=Reyranella soli TaxID=1230389 RepID=A0A512NQF7_9HYPH|nr:hypothetical protein RSO01_83350 [Reyranella soli]